jgi:hypothetical protein
MRKALILLIFALAACDKEKIAPRLTATITAQRTSPTSVLIKVHVGNERDTATVPLDVEVSAEPRQPSGWGEPVRVIHPVPFVLNKHESRDLQTMLVTSAGARATLTVREAERGLTVVTRIAAVE